MRRALIALALVLWATPVGAAVEFFSALDHCVADPSTDTNLWGTVQGAPSRVTSSLDGQPGNRCAYGMSPASGSALYVAKTTACGATCYAGFHVKLTSCPSTRRRLVSFRDTGGSKDGALVTVEADPSAPTARCILKAFYESEDLTGGECAASATMDGTECGGVCATNADCVTYNGGSCNGSTLRCQTECDAANVDVGSTCSPGTYAQITVPTNSWRAVTLGQVNTTGAVQVLLYEGAVGSSYQRGAQTRTQGKCTGGTTAGRACTTGSDCSGGGSCTTSDVVTIEEIRFGTDDTRTGAFAWVLDSPWIDTATAQANVQVQTWAATAQDTADANTNWAAINSCVAGSQWACVNDGITVDSETTAWNNAAAAKPTIAIQFATPNPTPSPLAVAAVVVAQDAASGGANSATVDLEFRAGASLTSAYDPDGGTDGWDLEGFTGTGGTGDPYYAMPPLFSATAPDGTSWDFTDFANMRLHVNKTAGSGDAARITNVATSGLFRLPDPPAPTVIPDRNRNGIDTVVLAGDSTWNQPTFHQTLASGLLEPTNLIECAVDGGTIIDVARDISVTGAANDIVETAAAMSSGWGCTSIKGTTGDTADVVLVGTWANTQHIVSVLADPAMDTGHEGQGTGMGYCDDNGGAQQGGTCSCPLPDRAALMPAASRTYYCRVRGTNWKRETAFPTSSNPSFGCTCSSNADCKLTAGAADGVCTGNVCVPQVSGASHASVSDDPPNAFYATGCLNAPGCTNGICLAVPNEAYLEQARTSIQAAVAARPTNTGTWVTPTPPAPTPPAATPTPRPPVFVWALPYPPLQNFRSGVDAGSSFPTAEQKAGKAREELKAKAEAAGMGWVDLAACFLRDCPDKRLAAYDPGNFFLGQNTDGIDGTQTYCLKDGIHPSDVGDIVQANCIANCLTNAQGTSDGICGPSPTPPLPTPGTRRCTQGKVNDNCTTNADCSTYHCDFAAAP